MERGGKAFKFYSFNEFPASHPMEYFLKKQKQMRSFENGPFKIFSLNRFFVKGKLEKNA